MCRYLGGKLLGRFMSIKVMSRDHAAKPEALVRLRSEAVSPCHYRAHEAPTRRSQVKIESTRTKLD
jgi:hypothetical protein